MIHKVNGGCVISSHKTWMPGFYADERAARYAFRFDDKQLRELQEKINPLAITFEMLRHLRNPEK